MIQTKIIDGRVRNWSDTGMKIRQIETGIMYDDAVDVLPCRYTYEESNIPIDSLEPPDNLAEVSNYLIESNLVELPKVDEPDYFGELEPEPDYFA